MTSRIFDLDLGIQIDDDTPIEIMHDYLESYGAKTLDHARRNVIKTHDLSRVARFVNKDSVWTEDTLIKAYDRIFTELTEDDFKLPIRRQTKNETDTISPLMLLRFCQSNSIKTRSWHTSDCLKNLILEKIRCDRVLRRVREFYDVDGIEDGIVIKYITKKTRVLDNATQTNIDLLIDDLNFEKRNEEIVFDILKKDPEVLNRIRSEPAVEHPVSELFDSMNNKELLWYNIEPTSNSGSISLAALLFKKDISLAMNPLREFLFLKKNSWENGPDDSGMKRIWSSNPDFFDMTKTINPIFGWKFYSNLTQIMMRYGIFPEIERIPESNEEKFNMILGLKRWHRGMLPTCNVETLISLEDVQVSPNIISFGSGSSGTSYSIEEIIESFIVRDDFVTPDLKKLTKREVKSLMYICENVPLIEICNKILNKTKPKIDESHLPQLRDLLELGMMMRGWSSGPFPLNSEDTLSSDIDAISLRISLKWNSMGKLDKKVLNLPLMTWRNGIFMKISDGDGKNFDERMKSILSEKSCIRTSSNYICFSCWYYINMISNETPFSLRDVSFIS